jgi:hypothetical protein
MFEAIGIVGEEDLVVGFPPWFPGKDTLLMNPGNLLVND